MAAGHELMWMEEEDEEDEKQGGEAAETSGAADEGAAKGGAEAQRLQADLDAVRKELGDVRRELAAKTIQLSKRDTKVEEEAKRRAKAEAEEEMRRKQEAQGEEPKVDVEQLESDLETLRAEVATMYARLDDAEKTRLAQDKALREATATAEAASAVAASEESARHAYEQQAEHEIDKLTRELASLKNRTTLQLQQKAAEVSRLEAEAANAEAIRAQAVRDAIDSAAASWAEKVADAERAGRHQVKALEQRVLELQVSIEDGSAYDNTTALLEELAAIKADRAEINREFESFREMAGTTAREKSGEITRLLEENAALRARMAHSVTRDYTNSFGIDMPDAVSSFQHHTKQYAQRIMSRRPHWMALGHKSILLLLGLVMMTTLLMFALMRASLSARGPNRWLCVLEKLGIVIGDGCLGINRSHMEELIDEIIEDHPRAM